MSVAQRVIRSLKNLFRRRSEPQDPLAHVPARLKRGPEGLSSAVALEEPPPTKSLNLFAGHNPK